MNAVTRVRPDVDVDVGERPLLGRFIRSTAILSGASTPVPEPRTARGRPGAATGRSDGAPWSRPALLETIRTTMATAFIVSSASRTMIPAAALFENPACGWDTQL
ncbi:MAG: hypothetical protein R2752_14715 [Vicinamibacterales bacterium]